jgi:hypothetical protein
MEVSSSIIFTPIPGFDNYEISLDGIVRSIDREVICKNRKKKRSTRIKKGKILSVYKTPNGRPFVVLYKGKKRFNKLIHTLVYESFIGKVKGIIKHHDGNLENNHISNLYVDSQSNSLRKANRGRLRGVERYKKTDKWMVRFAVNGKRVFFGIYKTKLEAYEAYHKIYKNIFAEEPFDMELLSAMRES